MIRSLLVLMIVVPPVASAPVPKGATRADFFPLAVGHKWEYTGGNHTETEVTAAEAHGQAVNFTVRMKYRDGTDATLFLTRTADRSLLLTRNAHNGTLGEPYRTPVAFLPTALKAGHKWQRVFDTGATSATTYSFEVESPEQLTVGGKTYMATPVKLFQVPNGPQIGTTWYADGVGIVKDANTVRKDVLELKSFTPGK